VAVTATDGTKTKGGIGVFVGAVGLGSQGQSEELKQSMSKIKFTVPLALPISQEQQG
jgi:small neutral amino acid transporter SnatA (MarC family)